MSRTPDPTPGGGRVAVASGVAQGVSGQFLVDMSRELRAELGALGSYLELLRGKLSQAEDQELVGAAMASAQQLTITLNSAVDYARAVSGDVTPKVAKFNLRQLIDEVVGVVGVDARQREIVIRTQLASTLPRRLLGDRLLIGECLAHVLHNAVSFGRTSVVFEVKFEDGMLVALVEDDGPGVPDALTDQAFLPFETLQAGKDQHGNVGPGLGLAVTRAFTELLGGTVEIMPGRARGTVVELRWPIEPVHSWTTADSEAVMPHVEQPVRDAEEFQLDEFGADMMDLQPFSQSPATRKPSSDTRSIHHVLVVDDDPHLRSIVVGVLDSMGVSYDHAADGAEGLEKLRRAKHTALVVDMKMPVMSGFAMVRQVRQDPALRGIHVLALTGMRLREERDACFEAGCDLFQGKPVTFERLSRRISELLSLRTREVDSQPTPSMAPPAQANAVAANIAGLRQRYAASFPTLNEQLARLLDDALKGSSEAVDGLRATLHRMAGTAGSLYYDQLSESCAAASTTVRAMQRAYPDPTQLPPESRRALSSAIHKVQLVLATFDQTGERSSA